jgi:hypothetical protein
MKKYLNSDGDFEVPNLCESVFICGENYLGNDGAPAKFVAARHRRNAGEGLPSRSLVRRLERPGFQISLIRGYEALK